MENNRVLKLTGMLDQRKTLKRINSDLRQLEHSVSMLRVTAAFAGGDTKEQLDSFLGQAQARIDQANLTLKVDAGHLNSEIEEALHNVSFQDINLLNIDEGKITLTLEKIIAEIRTLVNSSPIPVNLGVRTEELSQKLDSYMSKNSKIETSSVLQDEADKVRDLINSITDRQSFEEADKALKLFQSTVRATGFETTNALDKIKAVAAQTKTILGVLGLATSVVDSFSKSLETLKDNDSIISEISRFSQLTKSQLSDINDRSFKVAGRYGQSSGDYLRVVQEMSLAGYQDPGGMAQLSSAAQSAGNMTADLANQYIIATDKAFDMGGAVSVLATALDGANNIATRHSLSMSDLAEAMSLAGSQAADSGLKVNETTAALSAMMSVTQQSGSQAADALKSLLMNLSQITGEVGETGTYIDSESLERYQKACANLGVSLTTVRNGVVSLKEPMEIIRELSAAYASLAPSDSRRSNLLESVGSQAGADALKALLENYDLYEEMLRDYAVGMGSLDQEAARAASSWEGRLNSLQNSWDSFVNTMTNKELILNGISFFDRLIQGAETLADTIGEIPVMMTTVNAAMVMKNKDYGINSLINAGTGKLDIQGNIFGIDFTALKEMKKHFSDAQAAITSWNDELNDGQTDINLFENEIVQNNAALKNYLTTCSKEAPGSIEGYRAYLQASGETTDVLRLKTLLLTSAISMGLGWALQAAITLITNYIHRIEQADNALSDSVSAYQTTQAQLSSINSELETQSRLMDELLSKDDLTGSEKDRLKNLQAITRELELQKALKEEEVKREARNVAQKTVEAYETRHNAPVSDIFINANYNSLQETGINSPVLNNVDNINQQIAAYRILREEQQKALSSQSEDYEDIAAKTQIIEDNLYQQLETTEEYRKQLISLPYDELTEKQKQILDQLNSDREFLWKELDPGKWNDYQMESIFDQNDLKMTKQQLIELVKAGEFDEDFILSNSELMEALSKLNLSLEDGVTNTQSFIHYMKALGDLTPDIPTPSTESDFSPSSMSHMVDNLNNMTNKWKAVNELYDEFLAKGTGQFTNKSMAGVVDAFKEIDGVNLDRFLSVLSDSSSTADEVQGAFNQLAMEYLFFSGCLEGLTDATAEQMVKELESLGITNASAVIHNYLAASKEFCALTGKDLASATQEEVLSFLNEASASDETRAYIAQLELAKRAANDTKINTSSDIDQVLALARAARVSDEVISDFNASRGSVYQKEKNVKANGKPKNQRSINRPKIKDHVKATESTDNFSNEIYNALLDASSYKTLIYKGNTPSSSAAPSTAPQLEQEKQATIETIDWIQRKSDVLKDHHDLLSTLAEDEAASYDKRIDALTQLIEMDKERVNTAQQSAQACRESWKEAIKDLQDQDIARIMVGLSDQEVTDIMKGLPEEDINRILELLHREDITKLMSENLSQEEYSSDDYGEDYANNLKEALDLFDQIKDKQKEALEIEQDSLEHIREQIQLREELIQAQQELLSLELENAQARLDMAEASGEAVTKGMYRDMISSSQDLADSYRDQIDDLEEQLSQIDDEDSAQYQSLLAQIAKCEQSIANCERQQEEWNDAIKRIPIDRISKYISMLQNIKQDLQNFLDQQSAMGLEASPEQLQQMMSISEEEIKKLLEQQEKLQKLLSDYEYGSEKFQQTSQEIQDIDNQISSLIQSQMEYNEAILQMPLDQLKRQSDLLSNARSDLENHIAEQESGGISKTLEQYQALSSLSRQQLENLAAQKEMLTALLDVYDPDSTKYKEVQDQIQTIEGSISSLVQEQNQWNDQILQIPIDRLQDYGDALSNARSDLENAISQQEAQGLGKTLEQYQALHSMSMRQLEALGQQKAVLQSVMEVYDKDSDHYKEAQNQLQGIEDSISSLIQEQIQWNNEILQIPIQKIQDYSNSLSNARTDLENSIAEQEARGVGKTMEQYKAMQSMSMRQLENLSRQKEMLFSLLDVYDKDSSQYAETQNKIQEIENSVSSLVQEQARWNQELLRIPIDKIASQYDALSNARKDLENSLSLQESQGMGKTLEQYQALSSISRQQIQSLSQQKEMLTALLDVYDKDSDIYSQTQNEIQGIEDSISSLIQEQIQWNQELTQLPIDKMKEYSDSLDSVKSDLKEFMDAQNARGITATPDQYQQLNAITLAQLEALRSRKEMLTQLMGQYSQDSDAYKTASQEIREVDSAIQSLTRDQYEWNKAILQLPIDNITDINDQLNRYTSVLGDILSDYDTALSAVNGVLDQQIDKINETREASEKAYEDKMKPIQDELDLLKKQNDARSVQLALEKAAYDLDRAKNQKTTQVIRDGQVQYEADADAIRQADEAKSQAEYNKIVYDLEKQLENLTQERDSLLEGYDTQIQQLDKIREKWSSITEEIKQASDLMKADEIFGTADWKDQILSGNDSSLFDPFQKMYESISAQKEQTEKQIASNERIADMARLFVEQYQNGSLTYSEAMSRISQLTDAMSGGYSAMEQLSGLMSSDGIKDLSQITSASADKVSAAASSLAQYMDMVRENNQSIQDYTASWAQIQADIAKRLADLETPPVSQDAFREYLEAANASKQELDQYIQSWEKVRDSVDDQVSALKSTAETMDQFRQYLEMVRENENELADYVQSWGTIKDSVDRQVEALDNASMSLEEFQKYLEAVKSNQDDLSGYTQTWSAIQEDVNRQVDLLEGMSKAFSDIQMFLDAVKDNKKGLEQYTQTWNAVRDGVESQVSALDSTASAMEQFRKHLEAYQANAEGISAYTSTWEKIKESIASQVEALKKAADSLDGVNKRLTGLSLEELKRRYAGAYERGGLICIPIGGNVEDDGKGWADDKENSTSSRSAASELAENSANTFGDAVQDMVSDVLSYNSYQTAAQKASAQSSIPDNNLDSGNAPGMSGYRPIKPGDFPLLDLMYEAMSGKEAQGTMFTDLSHMYEAASGKNTLAGMIRLSPQPYLPQNNTEVSFNGDIVVQGVQNPDAFAKALYHRIEPAMNQNFSKIFG